MKYAYGSKIQNNKNMHTHDRYKTDRKGGKTWHKVDMRRFMYSSLKSSERERERENIRRKKKKRKHG